MGASASAAAAASRPAVMALLVVVAVLVAAAQGQMAVKSTCVVSLGQLGASPWMGYPLSFPDNLAQWIWNAGYNQALGQQTLYFYAVYNAAAAGTAMISYTADNTAELSVNDVVVSNGSDWGVTYTSTVTLKQGTNIVQIKARNTDTCTGACSFAGLIASMKVGTAVVLRTGIASWQVSSQPRSLTIFDPTLTSCAIATKMPTKAPTKAPSKAPSTPSAAPSTPSAAPSTPQPTAQPTSQPTAQPTSQPTSQPTAKPTTAAPVTPAPVTTAPSTAAPSTAAPVTPAPTTGTPSTVAPSMAPTGAPSKQPTTAPTVGANELVEGDVAVVGYSSNTPKTVALVLLNNMRAGAQLQMTDNAYTGSAFKTTEGVVTFTASAALPRGTLLVWTATAPDWANTSGSFAISTSGDNVVLFSGSLAAPSRFHYALTYNLAFDAPSSTLTSSQCALPGTLAAARTALALPRLKAGLYNGPTAASREELLAAISDPGRWTQSDTVVFDFAALQAFSVRDGASEPTAQPTPAPSTAAPAPITSSPTTSSPTSSPTEMLVISPTTRPSSAAPPSTSAPVTASPTVLRGQEPDTQAPTSAGGSSGSVAMATGVGVAAVLLAGLAVSVIAVRRRRPIADNIGDDLVVHHRTADSFAASRHGERPVVRGAAPR
jgi:hypothetical protein